jgi:uncharacterized 2Fe-2S/4Fe-4S cluster protein (DUF4445 family)
MNAKKRILKLRRAFLSLPGSVKITFLREDAKTEAPRGSLLLDVMREAGVSIETPCNGMGICKKCSVRVNGKSVLACSFRVTEDIVEVDVPPPERRLVSVDGGRTFALPPDCDVRRAELPADAPEKLLGLAVDLGTTGISVCLMDLETGETLAAASCLNPQSEYGGDVVTRAAFCGKSPGNVEKLRRLVVDALNSMIAEMTGKLSGLDGDSIYRVFAAGNTVMLHIFAGINPFSMTRFPYRPVFLHSLELSPNGLRVNEKARVSLAPCVSAFVGGDITAGLAASGFARCGKNTALFVDIGTNGEIVLLSGGKLYATSTAAGPALEGMNISCGVRAVPGAIERVFCDEKGRIAYDTIAGAPPVGICGSGLIDLTAELLRKGAIDETGFLKNAPDSKYHLTEDIFLSQKDIRQIQLAKAAVAAGIGMLLDEAGGIAYEAIDEIFIAGAFGCRLDFENLKTIGMIGREFRGNVRFVGNASLEGAKLRLVNKGIRSEMSALADSVETVELSVRDSFQSAFIGELNFAGGSVASDVEF